MAHDKPVDGRKIMKGVFFVYQLRIFFDTGQTRLDIYSYNIRNPAFTDIYSQVDCFINQWRNKN